MKALGSELSFLWNTKLPKSYQLVKAIVKIWWNGCCCLGTLQVEKKFPGQPQYHPTAQLHHGFLRSHR